ncbi:MAG: hypothetical protein E7158_04305 [Firmicutes bacterium]|nr:hypothetical protein [Bacillota bacterium]
MKKMITQKLVNEEVLKDLEENIVDLKLDSAFKKVFSDESNKYYLAYLINYCTGMDIEYVESHLKYKNNFISGRNLDKKIGETDILVEVEEKVINIEMNKTIGETLIRKNKDYVSYLRSENVEKIKEGMSKRKFIIQINISASPRIKGKENERLVYEIELREKNLNISDVYNNEIIYDINLEYLKNNLYNKKKITEKEKNLLLFIERNKKELDKLFGGDARMRNIIKNIKSIGYLGDKTFAFEYDREAFREQVEKEAREEAVEEAKKKATEEGLKRGIEQEKIEIAKNLLRNGMSMENVSKNTGLSVDKTKKLKERI